MRRFDSDSRLQMPPDSDGIVMDSGGFRASSAALALILLRFAQLPCASLILNQIERLARSAPIRTTTVENRPSPPPRFETRLSFFTRLNAAADGQGKSEKASSTQRADFIHFAPKKRQVASVFRLEGIYGHGIGATRWAVVAHRCDASSRVRQSQRRSMYWFANDVRGIRGA